MEKSDLYETTGRSSKCAMHCCWKWRRARRCQNIRPLQNGERSTATTIRLSTVLSLISEIARSYTTERMKILKVCPQNYERLIKQIDKKLQDGGAKGVTSFSMVCLSLILFAASTEDAMTVASCVVFSKYFTSTAVNCFLKQLYKAGILWFPCYWSPFLNITVKNKISY